MPDDLEGQTYLFDLEPDDDATKSDVSKDDKNVADGSSTERK